jgi:hypothetical protein
LCDYQHIACRWSGQYKITPAAAGAGGAAGTNSRGYTVGSYAGVYQYRCPIALGDGHSAPAGIAHIAARHQHAEGIVINYLKSKSYIGFQRFLFCQQNTILIVKTQ